MASRNRVRLGEAGVSAGAAAVAGALSFLLGLFGPIGSVGRLQSTDTGRIAVATVSLVALAVSLIILAYKIATLFAAMPLLSHFLEDEQHADLERQLIDEHLLNEATGLSLRDLESRLAQAYASLSDPVADASHISRARAIIAQLPAILQYAGRWEREARWREARVAIGATAIAAAAASIGFAWSASPPVQTMVNGPIPVNVELSETGWQKLGCKPGTEPPQTFPALMSGVAVDGRLNEPVVILDASGNCRAQRLTVSKDVGLAIPRTPSPPSTSAPYSPSLSPPSPIPSK